jgi:hypothetical protein
MKERPVVEPLKHEALVDAVDHFAGFLASGIETEVLQNDKGVESNEQTSVVLRDIRTEVDRGLAPVAGRRLEGEKLGSPAFGCDARPLGCDRAGGFTDEVTHDLPTNGGIRIEEPF